MARTERVRPADQVIDYAIAIESMTKKRSGADQGKELARLIADPADAPSVEECRIAFRETRRQIVHDGVVPADVREPAALGEDLVRRSLRARTAGS